jgi:hypothetical protein
VVATGTGTKSAAAKRKVQRLHSFGQGLPKRFPPNQRKQFGVGQVEVDAPKFLSPTFRERYRASEAHNELLYWDR